MDFDMNFTSEDEYSDISDDILLFDFSVVDFENSATGIEPNANHNTMVQSIQKKRSSVFMHKKKGGPKLKRERSGPPHPNAKKPLPPAVLYAFPSFDKCDSLLFLPTSLTRHFNSGDHKAVKRLLTHHLDTNCVIDCGEHFSSLDLQSMLSMCQLLDEIQPDRVMCVHTTKVVDNQICATAYMKYTDNRSIYQSLANTVTDPAFKPLFTNNRWSEGCTEDFNLAHAEKEKDLLVYASFSMVVTFDDCTKKVVKLKFIGKITDMHIVDKMN